MNVLFGRKKKKPFAGQRRPTGLLNHRLLLAGAVLASAALFLLGQFGESGVASWWKLRVAETHLQQEVTGIAAANQELEVKLDSLANNPEALEKIAREKHNMRDQDEEVLTVLDRTGDSQNGRN